MNPAWLAGCAHASVFLALRSIAWADGTLDADEREMIIAVAGRLGLQVDRSALSAWIDAGEAQDVDLGALKMEDQFGVRLVLSEAIELGWADGDYGSDERAAVAEWARELGVGADELAALESEVEERRARSAADPWA